MFAIPRAQAWRRWTASRLSLGRYAAASVGISRKLAAFHLDRLVAAGLLNADYANLTGLRRVSRVPKVYEPAAVDVQLSIPQREHGLLADILLEAVLTPAGGRDGMM